MNKSVTPATTPIHFWRHWGPLVILALALGIIIIDSTILNVSLKYIINDFHTDIQSLQWVITGYSLTLAALTITGGRIGDFFGRKRMFMIGAILFAIGSFITSISQSVGVMILGESIIEGVGAALMMPATASLLLTTYQGKERALAFGVWGGIAGAASAIGPILGGYMTKYYDWRWGFRINVAVVAILLIGSVVIKESRDEEEKPTLDLVGVVLSALGLLSIVFAFIESSTYGWWTMKQDFVINNMIIWGGHTSFVPFVLAFGLVVLAGFGLWEAHIERQQRTPLVSLKLFQNRQFTSGAVTMAVISLGMTGLFFVLPVFWQAVKGYDALATGLVGLPVSLALLVVAPLGALLSHKISPKHLIQIGLVLNIIATLWLRASFSVDATWVTVAPSLALFGVGFGLVMAQISNLTLSAVPTSQGGEASGVNNTLRNVGASFGSAILGAVLLGAITTNLASGINSSPLIPAPMKQALVTAASTQTSNVEFGGGAQLPSSVPAPIKTEIISVSHQATVDAMKKTLVYTAIFSLLGLGLSTLLPNKKVAHSETAVAA